MTNKEAVKELKDMLERLNLNKYFSVKLVGVKMPYGEVEEKKDLNGLWLAIYKAIGALEREETCENKDCGTEMIFECSVCGASTIDRLNLEDGDFNFCPNCGRRVEK